jgi:hypothetical protein
MYNVLAERCRLPAVGSAPYLTAKTSLKRVSFTGLGVGPCMKFQLRQQEGFTTAQSNYTLVEMPLALKRPPGLDLDRILGKGC